jgi:hypothetical protein
MNTLTIWQPWCSAIPAGLKKIETRGWPAPISAIGQRIAIHAAKRWTREETDFWTSWRLQAGASELMAFENIGIAGVLETMPRSCVVATAVLADCRRSEDLMADGLLTEREQQWGNFTPGRFGWMFSDVRPLTKPIPASGLQKLWNWEPPAGIE